MKRVLLFVSCVLFLAAAVFGMSGGTTQGIDPKLILTGIVYDSNHAVIAGSQVVAQDFEGKEYSALTNGEGVYKLELPFATYIIEANASGFCPKRVDVLKVHRSLTVKPLDFVLQFNDGDRPCPQKTMIKKEQNIRKPEIFRSIAE